MANPMSDPFADIPTSASLRDGLRNHVADLEAILAKLRDAIRLIHREGHEYRPTPCVTCKAVSNLIGEPFGCEAYKCG